MIDPGRPDVLEVPFWGHARGARAVELADQIGPGELTFATTSGTVLADVAVGGDGVVRATLTSVLPYVGLCDEEGVDVFLELAFGAFLCDLGAVPADAEIVRRQDEAHGRPGLLEVELRAGEDRVRVTGAAVAMEAGAR